MKNILQNDNLSLQIPMYRNQSELLKEMNWKARMPRYFSLHTVACLTRQQLSSLVAELKKDSTVDSVRCVCDSVEGKLLCEFEAPNREIVEAFLTIHNMHPHWIMRVEHDWS